MSIISRLRKSMNAIWGELTSPMKTAALTNPAAWQLAEADSFRYNMPSAESYEAQADLYRVLSWVNIAISNMAAIASITEINVKSMDGERDTDIPNHEFEKLLMRPNPLYSRFELFNTTFCFYGLNNNAYWYLIRKDANTPPTEIWPVNPAHIQPVPDKNSYLKGYVYTPPGGGEPYPLEPWEISHYKGFNPNNPFVGLSKMESIVTDARSDINQQEWNLKVFGKNNGRLPGILAFNQTYTPEQWEKMKKDLSGNAQMRSYMLLQGVGTGDVSLINTGTSPKDMEFLSGRRFTMEEIFAVVAPGLASILSVNATEANARTGKATLIEFVIWPLLVMMSEKITNDILPAYGPNLKAEFDDIRITDRALILSETAEYAKYHTPNEVRAKYYNSDPIEGGDVPAFGQAAQQPAPQLPAIPQPVLQIDTEQQQAMAAWQRKAVKRLKEKGCAACDFESDHIQPSIHGAIDGGLAAAKTVDDVKRIFTNALEWRGYP